MFARGSAKRRTKARGGGCVLSEMKEHSTWTVEIPVASSNEQGKTGVGLGGSVCACNTRDFEMAVSRIRDDAGKGGTK
jgi:hypothetical protein